MSHIILLTHALTGMLFVLACVWIFVETLSCSESNISRIRAACYAAAAFLWATIFIGGYFYVLLYAPDKALILKGPWPFAHKFVMETKEHVLLMLIPMATFLPLIASNHLPSNPAARKLLLWVSGLAVAIGVGMEGAGAIISMGAKLGLIPA